MVEVKVFLFRIFNLLYKPVFPLYKVLYFFYKQNFEREEINFLKNYLKNGMTVLDIGANIGFYTTLMAGLVGNKGKVYAFEPDIKHFKHLKQITKTCKNIIIINSAIGEKNKSAKIYLSDELNVDHQTFDSGEGRKFYPIAMITIDSYFKDKAIDLIKIDIQGYDYFALLGMQKTIQKSKSVVLMGELWPYGLKRAGSSAIDYLNLLKKMGFAVKYFKDKDKNESKALDKNIYYDFFAIKK